MKSRKFSRLTAEARVLARKSPDCPGKQHAHDTAKGGWKTARSHDISAVSDFEAVVFQSVTSEAVFSGYSAMQYRCPAVRR